MALAVMACNKKSMQTGTIELVVFQVKPGYSESEVIQAAEKINRKLAGFDGFIHRELSCSKDGTWTDMVQWESLAEAEEAAAEIMKSEEAMPFFGMIEESSMQFLHLSPRMQYAKVRP